MVKPLPLTCRVSVPLPPATVVSARSTAEVVANKCAEALNTKVSSPAPPSSTSAPGLPVTVSLPAPPVMLSTPKEPTRLRPMLASSWREASMVLLPIVPVKSLARLTVRMPAAKALASRVMLKGLSLAPEAMASTPLARAKVLVALMVKPSARMLSVSVPSPPRMESVRAAVLVLANRSVTELKAKLSLPSPPSSRSTPAPPVRLSLPVPPTRVSLPLPPPRVSLPPKPYRAAGLLPRLAEAVAGGAAAPQAQVQAEVGRQAAVKHIAVRPPPEWPARPR